jgi:hypothetical protein
MEMRTRCCTPHAQDLPQLVTSTAVRVTTLHSSTYTTHTNSKAWLNQLQQHGATQTVAIAADRVAALQKQARD